MVVEKQCQASIIYNNMVCLTDIKVVQSFCTLKTEKFKITGMNYKILHCKYCVMFFLVFNNYL